MARVTVEDCVDKIPNRFELVLLAAHRARAIANGSAMTVAADDDKNPVIALREIADRKLSPDDMRETATSARCVTPKRARRSSACAACVASGA